MAVCRWSEQLVGHQANDLSCFQATGMAKENAQLELAARVLANILMAL